MATTEQCPAYEKCGFVAWRQKRPDSHMPLLPEDGDCGKDSQENCPRYKYLVGNEEYRAQANQVFRVENTLTNEGPISDEEVKIAFPSRPNNNNRPERRIIGGAHS